MRDYRAKSFWLEQVSSGYAETPPLEGLVRADVLIIGGGYTGLSTAWHLKQARPGLRVVLLEADVAGFGASGRNSGILSAPFYSAPGAAVLRINRHKIVQAHHYAQRAVSYLDEQIQACELSCEYEHSGFLRVATTPVQAQRIQRQVTLAQQQGIENIEWLDGQATRALVDSPKHLGAWHTAQGGVLNPASLARELKRIAVGAGAEVYERSPVTRLEIGALARAQTPLGAVEADRLVLATNAFTAQFPLLRSLQFPVHSYAILTEQLTSAQIASIGWLGRQGVQDDHLLPHSYRLTPDQRLLVSGGTAHYFYGNQTGVDQYDPAYRHLERFTAATFPSLRGVRVTHRWGGAVSFTWDALPRIGFIGRDRRVIYSVGCMGHGASIAHLNGWTISDLLLELQTERTEVCFVNRKVMPLPPEPLRLPLANGILGVIGAQDALDFRC